MSNIGVFCVLHCGDSILLSKKNYDNLSWTLPGGAVEEGETLEDALRRELKEEVSLECNASPKLFGAFYSIECYSTVFCYQYQLTVDQREVEIQFSRDEFTDAGWFDVSALPSPISHRYVNWIQAWESVSGSSSLCFGEYL